MRKLLLFIFASTYFINSQAFFAFTPSVNSYGSTNLTINKTRLFTQEEQGEKFYYFIYMASSNTSGNLYLEVGDINYSFENPPSNNHFVNFYIKLDESKNIVESNILNTHFSMDDIVLHDNSFFVNLTFNQTPGITTIYGQSINNNTYNQNTIIAKLSLPDLQVEWVNVHYGIRSVCLRYNHSGNLLATYSRTTGPGGYHIDLDLGDGNVYTINSSNHTLFALINLETGISTSTFDRDFLSLNSFDKSIEIDNYGNIYVGMRAFVEIDFGNGITFNPNDYTTPVSLLIKFNENLDLQWIKPIGNEFASTTNNLHEISDIDEIWFSTRVSSGEKLYYDNQEIAENNHTSFINYLLNIDAQSGDYNSLVTVRSDDNISNIIVRMYKTTNPDEMLIELSNSVGGVFVNDIEIGSNTGIRNALTYHSNMITINKNGTAKLGTAWRYSRASFQDYIEENKIIGLAQTTINNDIRVNGSLHSSLSNTFNFIDVEEFDTVKVDFPVDTTLFCKDGSNIQIPFNIINKNNYGFLNPNHHIATNYLPTLSPSNFSSTIYTQNPLNDNFEINENLEGSTSHVLELYQGNYVTHTFPSNFDFQVRDFYLGNQTPINLYIQAKPTSFSSTSIIECDSFTAVNGITYYENTIIYDTLTNVLGCDSIITYSITINNSTYSEIEVTACDSFFWNETGLNYTESGSYTSISTNSDNCNHYLTLNLEISESDNHIVDVTSCDEYFWDVNQQTYYASGTFEETFSNQYNCDSTITLNLTINYSDTSEIAETACNFFLWHLSGDSYTNSGIYEVSLLNQFNCDSIVQLNLTILQNDTITLNEFACNQFYWETTNETYSQSGIYQANLNNQWNCDSILILNLEIGESDTTNFIESSCSSFFWSVNNTNYQHSGIYEHLLTNHQGCDSIVQLDLTINQPNDIEETVVTCNSFTWNSNGNNYTESGTYQEIFQNQFSCDSIVSLNLTINESDTTHIFQTECDIYFWDLTQTNISQSGVYEQILDNQFGCDSVVYLNLTINTSDTLHIQESACEEFFWDVNNELYSNSGIFEHTLQNQEGCDSVIVLNLEIHTNTLDSIHVTTCNNFLWEVNNQNYSETGIYPHTLSSVNGCDSTLILELQIIDLNISNQSENEILIENKSPFYVFVQHENSFTNVEFEWQIKINEIYEVLQENETFSNTNGDTLFINPAMIDENEITVKCIVSKQNCDTVSEEILIQLDLKLNLQNLNNFGGINIYPNPTSDFIVLEIEKEYSDKLELTILDVHGKRIEEKSFTAPKTRINMSNYSSGMYLIKISNKNGDIILKKVIKN